MKNLSIIFYLLTREKIENIYIDNFLGYVRIHYVYGAA